MFITREIKQVFTVAIAAMGIAGLVQADSIEITTTDGTGGVSGLVNYKTGGDFGGTQWHVKNAGATSDFTRKGYIRFDTSGIDFTATHAALKLTVTLIDAGILDYDQTIWVYGITNQVLDSVALTDGLPWTAAPANDTNSAYAADLTEAQLLGTFQLDYDGDKAAPAGTVILFTSPELVNLINADTDGVVTLILGRTGTKSGNNLLFAGDTHATFDPPALTACDNTPVVVNTASKIVPDTGTPGPANLESIPTTLSFDAGATADKLIVSISAETGGVGTPVITYNGVALKLAAGTAVDKHKGIFYLDNPYTGGEAPLVVDLTAYAAVNGVGFGVASISGSRPGVEATASDPANNVTITPTIDGCFVMAGFGAQDAPVAGAANGALTRLYGGYTGSAEGAAGYENGVAATPQNYSFSGGTTPMGAGAAAFRVDKGEMTVIIR